MELPVSAKGTLRRALSIDRIIAEAIIFDGSEATVLFTCAGSNRFTLLCRFGGEHLRRERQARSCVLSLWVTYLLQRVSSEALRALRIYFRSCELTTPHTARHYWRSSPSVREAGTLRRALSSDRIITEAFIFDGSEALCYLRVLARIASHRSAALVEHTFGARGRNALTCSLFG